MLHEINWSQVGRDVLASGLTAVLVSALATLLFTGFWERRKLIRAERVRAYGDYLAADSERWRAFGDRDGARKSSDTDEERAADLVVQRARHDMYAAYALTQVAGSPEVVKAMLACMRLSDDRQRAFKGQGSSPGQDRRAGALRALITAARKDLGLKALPPSTFSKE